MARSNTNARVAKRIRALRHERPHLTLRHVADFLGVSEEDFEAIEQGRARPTPDQIMLLADLLEVPPSQLFVES